MGSGHSLATAWDGDLIPIRDALAGGTIADNDRHVIARYAFLRLLLRDERTQQLFKTWRESTPIGIRATRLAEVLDELAESLGLENRQSLLNLSLDKR